MFTPINGPLSRHDAEKLQAEADVNRPLYHLDFAIAEARAIVEAAAKKPLGDWLKCVECNAGAPLLQHGLCNACLDIQLNQHGLPYATHPATWGERSPATLIQERAARWSARSEKWHRVLETERAWSARGVSVPALVGSIAAALVAINAWHHVPGAFAYPALAMVIGAAFMWRASIAKVRLEVGRANEAWAIADRYAEHYRGLIAQIDEGRDLHDCLRDSQALEAAARFGLPESVKSALHEVTR